MRIWIKDNGGIVAIIATIAVGMWWIQSTITKGQIEQQKQFTEMIEKIGKIESDSKVRDKDLEIAIIKISK